MLRAFVRLLRHAFVTVLIVLPAPAFATAQRTFVATTGNDADPCSITMPCRTFAHAITQATPGGEVVALTSGGYGALTITGPIAIVAPAGVYAGVTATGGATGITVSAGPSAVVKLRGLVINGIGGSDGIAFISGGMLEIEGAEVSGFNGPAKAGLRMQSPGGLFVRDSTFRDNYHGVFVNAETGPAAASFDHVNLVHNASVGLYVVNGGRVTITNSVASGNTYGIDVQALDGSTQWATIAVESCHVSNNAQDGIVIGGTGADPAPLPYIVVSRSVVTDNGGYGMKGVNIPLNMRLWSLQNNFVSGNVLGGMYMVNVTTTL